MPTPTAIKGTSDLNWEATDGRKKPNKLGWAVRESLREMIPTPTAQDAKNDTLPPSQKDRDSVIGYLMRTEQPVEKMVLNPDWVELFMGFPLLWTAL